MTGKHFAHARPKARPGWRARAGVAAAAAISMTLGLTTVQVSTASALTPTYFGVYGPYGRIQNEGFAVGSITWYNRTASVSGVLTAADQPANNPQISSSEVIIQAYAGTTRVGPTQVVYRDIRDSPAVAYGPFSMGDTNLRGGIDRIKVTVCDFVYGLTVEDGDFSCGPQTNFGKPTS